MMKTTAQLIAEATAPLADADLDTATPPQIDGVLASLNGLEDKAYGFIQGAVERLHESVDDRRSGYAGSWKMSYTEAFETAQRRAADPAEKHYNARVIRDALDYLAKHQAAQQELLEAMKPYEAQFNARRWTRFFWVQNNGGHGHSSMSCSTCNKGKSRTQFGWHPELSGLTMADAVAKFGPTLCTVCFPDAPVEYTVGVKKDHCEGSRKAPVKGTERRTGMSYYGVCTGCGDRHLVNSTVVRAHKPKADKK